MKSTLRLSSAFNKRNRLGIAAVLAAINALLPALIHPAGAHEEGVTENDMLEELVIAPEYRCSRYYRDDYPYPQSIEERIIAAQGGIYSPYTGETFASRRETDIEHIVALSEAHDSGMCSASAAEKRRFAQDLENLTLAAPDLNSDVKQAKDAAEWLPDHNRCWYVNRIVRVKRKYGLTVDQHEAATLRKVVDDCR